MSIATTKFDASKKTELKKFIKEQYDNFHPLLNDQLFDWMYKDSEIYLYIDNNEIVGFNNYIKTQYQYYANNELKLIDSIHFAMSKVLDKYNGLNIILEPHKEYNLICGMGFNRKTILPILKQLKYTIIDPVPRVHMELTNLNKNNTNIFNIIDDVDCEKLENIWIKSTSNNNIFGIYRNKNFWKWRYIDNPCFKNNEKYHFYGNYEIGIIVFRKEKYINSNACRIVELIPYDHNVWNGVDNTDFNNLITEFTHWCYNNTISIIDFYCTHKNLLNTLIKNNFKYSDESIPNNFANPDKRLSELNYVINTKEQVDINLLYETKSCGDMDRPDGLIEETEKKEETSKSVFNIALLSSVNIDTLKHNVNEELSNYIKNVNIYTCDYGQCIQELIFEDSMLSKQNPNIIFLIDRPEDIINKTLDDYNESDNKKIESYFDSIRSYINRHSSVQFFIMEYFATEKTTLFNCADKKILNHFKDALQELRNEFPTNIDIINMDNLMNVQITDKRMWYIGKIPYTNVFFNKLSNKIVGLILSLKGLTSRLLILDLDNTLWGGVVGEDGIHGIKIGEDYPGNIFKDFQKKIKLLKDRGIALAICSKNDLNIVNEVFEKNNNMVLKKEDFVYIYANWNPKAENINEIAKKIGLGLKNILFVDDNPVEREQVKKFLPDVNVLELSKDPIDYIDNLLDSPLLEIHKLTDTDKKRVESYMNKVKIDNIKTSFTNKEDFYKQLDLEIYIHNLSNENKDRCVQLINKTNQFNATTLRLTEHDLSKYKIYVLGAKDKYNDYENMGILVTTEKDNSIIIENYLMSCRFLGKGLENEFIQWLLSYAKSKNYEKVIGKIIITDRNEPVRNIYKQNNFTYENDEYIFLINTTEIIQFKEYIKLHDLTGEITSLEIKTTNETEKKDETIKTSLINDKLIEIIKKLIDADALEIFSKLINESEINDELNVLPSWSSLKHIMLMNQFEETFNKQLDVDKMMKIKKISQLNELI